jgi:hypothetical protein
MNIRTGLVIFAVALIQGGVPAIADPLITDEEAMLPTPSAVKNARGISRGPSIRYEMPEPVAAHKPFTFKIEFEPHGKATIDPAKVQVTYLKLPSIDLTTRIRPFITHKGIDFPMAEVPAGRHPLRIDIEDSSGRTSQATLVLVAEK